jgi:hypothetical protein
MQCAPFDEVDGDVSRAQNCVGELGGVDAFEMPGIDVVNSRKDQTFSKGRRLLSFTIVG